MSELALLLLLAAAVLAWIDYRHVQEIAVSRCRRACGAAHVQFLDDTAALRRLRLARDGNSVVRVWRRFTFEYSTSLGDRRCGAIVMLGREPLVLDLDDAGLG